MNYAIIYAIEKILHKKKVENGHKHSNVSKKDKAQYSSSVFAPSQIYFALLRPKTKMDISILTIQSQSIQNN